VLYEGREVLDGRDVKSYRSRVQLIFQDPFASLNPVRTIRHHIERPLKIHHVVPRKQVEGRIYELLRLVGLVPPEEIARKYPHELSGGQRQRVAIARALAVQPSVILADEPISMLDVSIRSGILNLMLDLKREFGIAFLYITHDLASARYVADEVLVMYRGQIVEQGPTDEVLQNPLHPYTQLLLSAVPDPAAGPRERIATRHARSADGHDGCRFAPRCPVAVAASHTVTPQLLEPQPGHRVRCHLYDPEIADREELHR
jgi:peptide/nickel transport system ATP-binding protein